MPAAAVLPPHWIVKQLRHQQQQQHKRFPLCCCCWTKLCCCRAVFKQRRRSFERTVHGSQKWCQLVPASVGALFRGRLQETHFEHKSLSCRGGRLDKLQPIIGLSLGGQWQGRQRRQGGGWQRQLQRWPLGQTPTYYRTLTGRRREDKGDYLQIQVRPVDDYKRLSHTKLKHNTCNKQTKDWRRQPQILSDQPPRIGGAASECGGKNKTNNFTIFTGFTTFTIFTSFHMSERTHVPRRLCCNH